MQEILDNGNYSHMGETVRYDNIAAAGNFSEFNKGLRWITSHIPIFNDISVLHDFIDLKGVLNFSNALSKWGSMLPAGALTVGAVAGNNMALTWSIKSGLNER